MKIYDFRIEYREQPKGLAVKIPRFSWKIASGDNNVVQTAWHLIVSSAEKCFWDSGKIESDQSVLVPYAGQALTREQEYQVSLEIWDNYGNRAKAETAFTTGIFDTGDFQAKMITHDFPPEEMGLVRYSSGNFLRTRKCHLPAFTPRRLVSMKLP